MMGVRDAEQAQYAFPYKILDILGGDWCEGLDLDPLGKVINLDQEELGLPFSRAEQTDYIHSPYDKRPFRLEVWQSVVFLTLEAFFHKDSALILSSQPEVPNS